MTTFGSSGSTRIQISNYLRPCGDRTSCTSKHRRLYHLGSTHGRGPLGFWGSPGYVKEQDGDCPAAPCHPQAWLSCKERTCGPGGRSAPGTGTAGARRSAQRGGQRDALPLHAQTRHIGCVPARARTAARLCFRSHYVPFSQFLRQSAERQSSSEGEKSQKGERGSIAIKRDGMKNKGDGPMWQIGCPIGGGSFFLQIIRAPALKMDCPIHPCGSTTETRGRGDTAGSQDTKQEFCRVGTHGACQTVLANGYFLLSRYHPLTSNKPVIWGKLITARTRARLTDNHISNTAKCTMVMQVAASAQSVADRWVFAHPTPSTAIFLCLLRQFLVLQGYVWSSRSELY